MGHVDLDRKALAQYTNKDRDVRSMADDDFLNYSTFLAQQYDVHSTEKARQAFETTKNFRKIKTFRHFIKAIATILVVLLILALIGLALFAIIYFFVYYKSDPVKSIMDFYMLWTALCFVFIFILYFYLFAKMTTTIKKIMSLL